MNDIHEKSWLQLDLNLLRVFVTIWQCRQLGIAAEQLHVTPSAISHALRRLRDALGDPLFVRDGRRLALTPIAARLAPQVERHLEQLQELLLPRDEFVPATSRRNFVLGLRESLEPLVLPALLRALQAGAPGVSLASVRIAREHVQRALQEGELDVVLDVAWGQHERIQRVPVRREPLCIAMRAGHPLRHGMRLEDYVAAEHVQVSGREQGPTLEDVALERLGSAPRRVRLRCQNYHAACAVVAQSDALLTLPRQLAEIISEPLGNLTRSVPFAVPAMNLHLYWHERTQSDPALLWLRQHIMQANR